MRSKKQSIYKILLTIVFVGGLVCIVLFNVMSDGRSKQLKLAEEIETAMSEGYLAVVDGVEFQSLDSKFISSAPLQFDVTVDERVKKVYLKSKVTVNNSALNTQKKIRSITHITDIAY